SRRGDVVFTCTYRGTNATARVTAKLAAGRRRNTFELRLHPRGPEDRLFPDRSRRAVVRRGPGLVETARARFAPAWVLRDDARDREARGGPQAQHLRAQAPSARARGQVLSRPEPPSRRAVRPWARPDEARTLRPFMVLPRQPAGPRTPQLGHRDHHAAEHDSSERLGDGCIPERARPERLSRARPPRLEQPGSNRRPGPIRGRAQLA